MSKRSEISMVPRYAPTEVMLARAGIQPVISFVVHPPNSHKSAIRSDMTALELITPYGSRWYGVEHAYINSQLRMVVVGTNRKDEVRMRWKVVPKEFRE